MGTVDNNIKKKPNFRRLKEQDICFREIFPNDLTHLQYKKIEVTKNYSKFNDYINVAFDAALNKSKVEAKYELIDRDTEYKLSKKIKIKINSVSCNNEIIDNDETTIEVLKKIGQVVNPIVVEDISVNGKTSDFLKIDDYYVLDGDENTIVVINNDANIKFDIDRYYPVEIIYKGISYQNKQSRVNIDDFDEKCAVCNDANHAEIIFTLRKNDNKASANEFSLALIDDGKSNESNLDFFFSETATSVYINDDKNNSAIIKYKQKEIDRIKIQFKDTSIIPPKNGIVHLNADTNQLKRQRKAIEVLTRRPSIEQYPLLKLGLQIKFNDLYPFRLSNVDNLKYEILTDLNRPGTNQQRDFVRKALETPDFVILQGPPGSGKTTAILELIYQLTKRKKKVLLCASTHVAIDNVIEKILQSKNSKELLKYINPVRIADDGNVYSEEVKNYTYDNIHKKIDSDYKNIVDESFNLVCGTIIGVLKFPPIDEMLNNNSKGTIEPLFDYLIIDEASKTTFSEFLVPAVLCKRWIIVGDVKQLSPYIDQEDLTPNIQQALPLKTKENRDALGFLEQYYNEKHKNNLFGCAYILSQGSIEYINNHLQNYSDFISVSNINNSKIFNLKPELIEKSNPLVTALNLKNKIFLIEKGLEKQVIPYLNEKTLVFDKSVNLRFIDDQVIMGQFFRNKYSNSVKYSIYEKLFDNFSLNVDEQIVWRLIRLYELGENQKSHKSYNEYINRVQNIFDEVENKSFQETITMLKNIAIPSIITLLQEGVDKSNSYPTRLTSGFTEADKLNRFVRLEYQHRMAGEISKFSRENVYEGVALKDSTCWKSKLDYFGNNQRFEIRDIKNNQEIFKNINSLEINAITDELKKYIQYSKTHPKTNNEKISIAILSFYNGQVLELRKKLQEIFNSTNHYNFDKDNIHVTLNTVDKFQGQEADIVYLSMVQNNKTGFLDSVTRLNVALTRAKEKIIVFGNKEYFKNLPDGKADLLKKLFSEEN